MTSSTSAAPQGQSDRPNDDSQAGDIQKEIKALTKANRILQKRLTRSEKTRAEMEAVTEQREQGLKAALQKAESDRAQITEAKAQLTVLNQKLAERIEAETAALNEATDSLQQAKVQVVKSEKFSTLGELVAGVAHEINNPIGCITSNIRFVEEYGEMLLKHVAIQQQVIEAHAQHIAPADLEKIEDHAEDIDLEYIAEDLPKLITSMATSGDRIKAISRSLRTFARSDIAEKQPYDIHQGIDGTLLILRHRMKAFGDRPAITVIQNYGSIPAIHCYPGQINQVFMNIIANAIDAMDEGEKPSGPREISITTLTEQPDAQRIIVEISDNAGGMSEDVRSRIFESQFTTKAAEKGTGLGLSIARQIVIDTHQGEIECSSTLGQGTTFKITLPVS